jgi:hypothetical protein
MRAALIVAVMLPACGSSSTTTPATDASTDLSTDVVDARESDTAEASMDAMPSPLFRDDFEAHPLGTWADDSIHGGFRSVYNGLGENVIKVDGSKVLSQSPRASTRLDETHASLVVTVAPIDVSFELSLRMRTVRQLRTPTPNPWEVAWVVFRYRDEGHFYYFAPKPNGWELGKVDATKRDPSGPECIWPAYENCKYDGAQRYLATGTTPTFPIDAWYRVRVRQVGAAITVSVDDRQLTTFTDAETPYTSGSIGLYNEDANVHFDDVLVSPI